MSMDGIPFRAIHFGAALRIFSLPLLVLAVALLFLALGVYRHIPWADVPLHLAGSMALAVSYCLLLRQLRRAGAVAPLPAALSGLFVVAAVVTTGVLWEFLEFLVDAAYPLLQMQVSVANTMGDLALDIAGGLLGVLFFRRGF